MSMSRKDYEEVTAAIKREVEAWGSMTTNEERLMAKAIALRLSDVFAFNNPRFDRARFMKACGFDN